MLGQLLLRHSDNTLQSPSMSASEAAMAVKTLWTLRSEENFWEEFTRLLVNLKWNIPHYHAKEGHVDDMILVQVKEIIQEMYKIYTVVFVLKNY